MGLIEEVQQRRPVERRVGPHQIDMLRTVENHQLGARLDAMEHGRHSIQAGMAVAIAAPAFVRMLAVQAELDAEGGLRLAIIQRPCSFRAYWPVATVCSMLPDNRP